ncbi:MAG: hypothetical protein H6679_00195 [Epsilonproteobacteria bacterium]|nr:hypothetical protein [Campylobacterota bacterium]
MFTEMFGGCTMCGVNFFIVIPILVAALGLFMWWCCCKCKKNNTPMQKGSGSISNNSNVPHAGREQKNGCEQKCNNKNDNNCQ